MFVSCDHHLLTGAVRQSIPSILQNRNLHWPPRNSEIKHIADLSLQLLEYFSHYSDDCHLQTTFIRDIITKYHVNIHRILSHEYT